MTEKGVKGGVVSAGERGAVRLGPADARGRRGPRRAVVSRRLSRRSGGRPPSPDSSIGRTDGRLADRRLGGRSSIPLGFPGLPCAPLGSPGFPWRVGLTQTGAKLIKSCSNWQQKDSKMNKKKQPESLFIAHAINPYDLTYRMNSEGAVYRRHLGCQNSISLTRSACCSKAKAHKLHQKGQSPAKVPK